MTKTVVTCDICGQYGKNYMYEDGCDMDPSGNGYNVNWVYKDFCFEHMLEFVRENPKKKIKNVTIADVLK